MNPFQCSESPQKPQYPTVRPIREFPVLKIRSRREHLYELQLAQPLPSFDLTKTLISKMLPTNAHNRLNLVMHRFLNSFLVSLFRFSLLCFGCLLFVPTKIIMPVVPLMVATIVLPPVIFVTLFSLDVLVLLAYHYEFWFITALNTLNWVALGVIFGDIRAISCIGLWLSSQSVVFIDSNFRTFPTAVKSIMISGPFLIVRAKLLFSRRQHCPSS
ncbi:hypothetical protein PR003_g10461 [Phytophthora rubi]|uniref:Uncharacterized protein n=1 Tax=Phytophthora rubi TaxID=129364 RepID=A0A6A3MXB9_9STRA|nr:hypothetical protein PR001_g9991 [Phytophthora rubi]KAE9340499.1 hypothetical protein PR003_g10461 [Phytophthora rubi]